MSTLLGIALTFLMGSLVLAIALAAVRLCLGPTAQDRVLALDMLYICVMLMTLALGLRYGDPVYFEMALLIALVGFVGSIALAKFLLRGEVIE
jgi:multicomponent K+:H+ antiporter subunit F